MIALCVCTCADLIHSEISAARFAQPEDSSCHGSVDDSSVVRESDDCVVINYNQLCDDIYPCDW